MMNPDNFYELVKKMREVQHDYFRSPAPSALALAKKLEREVDMAVKEWALRDAPKQKSLI